MTAENLSIVEQKKKPEIFIKPGTKEMLAVFDLQRSQVTLDKFYDSKKQNDISVVIQDLFTEISDRIKANQEKPYPPTISPELTFITVTQTIYLREIFHAHRFQIKRDGRFVTLLFEDNESNYLQTDQNLVDPTTQEYTPFLNIDNTIIKTSFLRVLQKVSPSMSREEYMNYASQRYEAAPESLQNIIDYLVYKNQVAEIKIDLETGAFVEFRGNTPVLILELKSIQRNIRENKLDSDHQCVITGWSGGDEVVKLNYRHEDQVASGQRFNQAKRVVPLPFPVMIQSI